MFPKTQVIVNPESNKGRTRRRWRQIKEVLHNHIKEFRYEFTEKPLQAIEIAIKKIDGGQVYEAELIPGDGKPRFEVALLAKGKCMEAQIDAIDGKVLSSGEIIEGPKWRKSFVVDKANLVPAGRNRYFILEPGYRLHYRHGKETLIITVLAFNFLGDGLRDAADPYMG